jgi:hypothetical protein
VAKSTEFGHVSAIVKEVAIYVAKTTEKGYRQDLFREFVGSAPYPVTFHQKTDS